MTELLESSEDCWSRSCFGPCGYICCCRRMRKATRIQILWGWLLVMTLGSCAVLGALIYRPDNPYATPSDMRPVVNNFNPLFCGGAKIINSKVTFDAYLIQGDLTTDVTHRNIYESKSAFYVAEKQFYFYTFYLLRDSFIKMRHCPDQSLMFYVIRGQDNFNKWKDDSFCDDCFVTKRFIFYCDDFSMLVEDEDQYFLVYSNDFGTGTWVDLHVFQNRSIYDLGNSSPVCSNVYDCEVSIYDLEQTAIYQVNGYYNLDDNSHPEFTTKCVPRIWSYIIIHGVIAVLIGALGTVLIHKYCKDRPHGVVINGQNDERAPLLNSQLPPSYSSVILTPPKYEDVVKYTDSDLPSYSEALSAETYRQVNAQVDVLGPIGNEVNIEHGSQACSLLHTPRNISDGISRSGIDTDIVVNVNENLVSGDLHATNTVDVGHCNVHISEDFGNGLNVHESVGETDDIISQGVASDNLVARSINANIHTSMYSRNVNDCETHGSLS